MKVKSLIRETLLLFLVTLILNLKYNYDWNVSYISPASLLEYSRVYILMRGYLIIRIIQFLSFIRKQDDNHMPWYVYLGFIYVTIMSTIRIISPRTYLGFYYNFLISVGFDSLRVPFLVFMYYLVPIIDYLVTILLLLYIRKMGILDKHMLSQINISSKKSIHTNTSRGVKDIKTVHRPCY
jgi:hypothetical protein